MQLLAWCLETDEVRGQRAQRKPKKELWALADKISTYGRTVYTLSDRGVVVSECDLRNNRASAPIPLPQHWTSSWANKESKGTPERVLEAQRLISVGAVLGSSTRLKLPRCELPCKPLVLQPRRLQRPSDQADLPEGNVAFSAENSVVTRVGSVMPLVHAMRRWRHPRWDELRKRKSTW